jgi:hypothetical protein
MSRQAVELQETERGSMKRGVQMKESGGLIVSKLFSLQCTQELLVPSPTRNAEFSSTGDQRDVTNSFGKMT